MNRLHDPNTFFVFDLDDTLYQEVDYRTSGILHVIEYLISVYKLDFNPMKLFKKIQSQADWVGALCEEIQVPSNVKESILWCYRMHQPTISMDEGIKNTLIDLHGVGRVAILTDGRSITQRLKLKSLGLNALDAYVSEEWGAGKPDSLMFEAVMKDFPFESYVYVGDNIKKDFYAPNNLGWLTIGVRDHGSNVHSQSPPFISEMHKPKKWISDIKSLKSIEY